MIINIVYIRFADIFCNKACMWYSITLISYIPLLLCNANPMSVAGNYFYSPSIWGRVYNTLVYLGIGGKLLKATGPLSIDVNPATLEFP